MTGIGTIAAGREAMEVGPGDGFVIRPGFKGMREVPGTTTRKEYVVRV